MKKMTSGYFLPPLLLLPFIILFQTCNGGEMDDDDLLVEEIPDISGDFLLFFGTEECGGYDTSCTGEDRESHHDWVTGKVTITQDEEAVTIDFYDDFVFSGSVDERGTFSFASTIEAAEYTYTVTSSAVVYYDYNQERKVFEGEMDIDVSGNEVCALEGHYCGLESL